MAINKVVMNTKNGEEVLMDLTNDTVTPETLAEGTTAHNAAGNAIIGTMATTTVLYTEQVLTEEQKEQARKNIGAIDKTAYQYAKDGGYTGTEAEFSAKLAKELPTKVSELTNDSGYITGYTETDPTVPAWAKATNKPSYSKSEVGLGNVDNVKQYSASNPPPYPVTSVNGKTGAVTLDADTVGARPTTWTPTYTDVGADKSGTASSVVSTHNTKTDAHNDIRLLITALTTRLDALANSDDDTIDQMAEVVAYIKANRDLIEQVTNGKVSVTDIVNNLTTNVSNKPLSAAQGVALKALIDAITVPTKVSQLANDAGYLTQHQDISGKLDASALPMAINTALSQAKASGEFDGEKGDKGDSVKGDKGDPGATGSRGFSVLRITTAPSGYTTETGGFTPTYRVALSTVLSQAQTADVVVGDTVIYSYYTYPVGYVDASYVYLGARVSIRGATGAAGAAGYTPVKGTDYWTEVEKAAIVAEVIDSVKVEYPDAHVIYGDVGVNNAITIYGKLADGTYTFKYENEDGTFADIGQLVIDNSKPKYTNQIPISTDKDGSIYNGTGYKAATRGNSSGEPTAVATPSASNPVFFTGFIPAPTGSVIRLKNCFMHANGNSEYCTETYGDAPFGLRSGLYNASKAKVQVESWGNLSSGNTNIFSDYTNDSNNHVTQFTVAYSGISFVRLTLAPTGDLADAIVTVNQEID